ncbi:MAG: hypothetical protein M3414_01175 [Pseudomonadota bacterium]|nr:hypothetical protein [Pseudomonadota bacterium]
MKQLPRFFDTFSKDRIGERGLGMIQRQLMSVNRSMGEFDEVLSGGPESRLKQSGQLK